MRTALLFSACLVGLAACGAPEPELDAPVATDEPAAAEQPASEEESQEAAGLPATDIALAEMSWENGRPQIGALEIVTGPDRYDNQPAFDAAGGFFFTTEAAGANTDIHYRAPDGVIRIITQTPDESEYSARPSPDGQSVTYIHQPPGQVGGQAWRQQLAGGNTSPVHAYGPAGYYALSGEQDQLLLFALTDPFTLLWFDLATGDEAEITSGIGRALYTAPDGRSAYFTLPGEADNWTVNRFDFDAGPVEELFTLPGETQDYAVFSTPQGTTAWLAVEGQTLMYREGVDADWQPVADLSPLGEGEITRLAVSPDARRLAVVIAETD